MCQNCKCCHRDPDVAPQAEDDAKASLEGKRPRYQAPADIRLNYVGAFGNDVTEDVVDLYLVDAGHKVVAVVGDKVTDRDTYTIGELFGEGYNDDILEALIGYGYEFVARLKS